MRTFLCQDPLNEVMLARMSYIHLIDEAKFGDVSMDLFRLLCKSGKLGIIQDIWVTPEEIIRLLTKAWCRAETRYLLLGQPMVADNYARRRENFYMALQKITNRQPTHRELKQILGDIIFS